MKGQKADNRWAPSKEELFLKLYNENHTLETIADALGTTKNAVMGKRTRLGLKARKLDDLRRFNRGRGTLVYKPKPKRVEKTMTLVDEAPMVAEAELPVTLIHPEMMKRISIFETNSSVCRWPLWGQEVIELQDKFFCGNPVERGTPYCPCHFRIGNRISSNGSRQNFVPYKKDVKI